MNRAAHVLDVMLHPRCQARRTNKRLLALISTGTVVTALIAFLVPYWWALPIAIFSGFTIMTHPLCLITHYHHKEGGASDART